MGVIRGLQFAEPIVLLMMGMRSLEAFVIPVLVADRVASSLNISDYTNLERHPCLKNNTDSEALIQAKSAHWMMAYWLMSSLPGALTALLIGGWSDRVGRRLPIMLALLGFAASAGVTMIVAHWKLPLTVLIAGASIEGLLGGYPTVLLASYAHASDVSSSSKRTSRLIILNAMECVGSGSMQLIGGTMLKHHGVLLTECIVLGGHFLNLLYTGVFLASSTGPQQQQQTQTEVVVVVKPDNTTAQHLANSTEPQHLTNSTEPQDLINCTEPQQLDGSIEPQQQPQTEVMLAVKPDNPTIQQTPPAQVPIAYGPEGPDKISPISYLQSVWKTFALLLKPWKHRREFVLLLVVFQCLVFMFIGPNGLIVLYGMHQPLCWTSVMTGYFVSSRFAAMVISCLCLAPLIYWFKIPDRLVVQLSVFGMTGFFGAMALARHTSIMFIGSASMALAGPCASTVRAMISKLVSRKDHGAVFAVMASLELIFSVVSVLTFNSLYSYFYKTLTVPFLPNPGSLCFLIAACATIVPVILMCFLPWKNTELQTTSSGSSPSGNGAGESDERTPLLS